MNKEKKSEKQYGFIKEGGRKNKKNNRKKIMIVFVADNDCYFISCWPTCVFNDILFRIL